MKARLPCATVWFVLCALLAGALPASASPFFQSGEPGAPSSLPLQSLLNPDGTLDLSTGFSGSLDAAGWRMTTGPDGEPRFTPQDAPPAGPAAPALAGDEYWDDLFMLGTFMPNQSGYGNEVVTVDGTDVYVGGLFDYAGDVPARNIARWDSTAHRWSALGSGVDDGVEAITVHGDDVLVGGEFQHAGDVDAIGIATWSKSTGAWSSFGTPLARITGTPYVSAIVVGAGGDIYVGGRFDTTADGTVLNNIARWDGSAWNALGGGVTGGNSPSVWTIAISGSEVYVGGVFTSPGSNIALWNGSNWLPVGGGTSGASGSAVNDIVIGGSYVYVGGLFDTVHDISGDHAVGHVAAWNGSSWLTLGGGVGGMRVWALAVGTNGHLYAGGNFTTLADNTTSAKYLAEWDGSTWRSLGGSPSPAGSDGVDQAVEALAVMGDDLYFGGAMTATNDGQRLNRAGRWNTGDARFYALGDSVSAPVGAIAFHGDDVFVGGVFTSAGGVPAMRIAAWNRRTGEWSALGSGLSGCTGGAGCVPAVYALAVDGDDIYVGGNFANAGDLIGVYGIAHWSIPRGKWYRLGNGVTCGGMTCGAEVRAISIADHHVFVGGYFDHVNGVALPARNVAAWTVSGWEALGGGLNNTVYALSARLPDKVYAGGGFTSPANYVALWNGSGWTAIGNGLNGAVRAMTWTSSSTLVIGGFFENAGGDGAADRIAVLKGGNWQALGDGLNGSVYSLEWTGERLCAGGGFTASGALGLTRIACFHGTAWSPLGSGATGTVYALGYEGGKLYAGGLFLNAGGKPSVHLGRWGVDRVYLPFSASGA